MLDPHLSEGLLNVTCFTHVGSNGWLLYWTHSTCVSLVVFRLHSDYNIFSGLLWINPTAQIYPVFQDKSVLNKKQQLNSISLYICSRDFLFPILFFLMAKCITPTLIHSTPSGPIAVWPHSLLSTWFQSPTEHMHMFHLLILVNLLTQVHELLHRLLNLKLVHWVTDLLTDRPQRVWVLSVRRNTLW